MSIKILGKYTGGKRSVMAGDTVVLTHNGKELVREEITKTMEVDTAIAFLFEDEFDMVEGVGGVIGKSKE